MQTLSRGEEGDSRGGGDADPESGGRRETQGEEVTQTLSRGRQASQWGLGQAPPPSRGAQGPGSPQQVAGFLLEM